MPSENGGTINRIWPAVRSTQASVSSSPEDRTAPTALAHPDPRSAPREESPIENVSGSANSFSTPPAPNRTLRRASEVGSVGTVQANESS
jgi:hypothetical protein